MTSDGYLVQYGRPAYVGRFAVAAGLTPSRGDRVVVRTPRGVELGEVLCGADDRFASGLDPSAGGELLRLAGPDDLSGAEDRESVGLALLVAAERSGLPLTILDVEVALDGAAAVLHVLPLGPCDADPLLTDLSARFGLAVRLIDISRTPTVTDPPEKAATCGKPDCGAGDCSSCGTGGCSTGSCSRGSVKTADELTSYFADLRRKMEQAAGRTPLN
ncbi:MAG TPA: hypothetical protein VFG68_10010 [Fimbriiglobus sp.]|nr:hypothetical protein [Fimbriiglobus sp.]